MKHYETFTYSMELKTHQAIKVGDVIDDVGIKLKVVDIQRVEESSMDDRVSVVMTVRELPDGFDRHMGETL